MRLVDKDDLSQIYLLCAFSFYPFSIKFVCEKNSSYLLFSMFDPSK